MDSWRIAADIASHGGNIYAETNRYHYSPVWFLILGGLEKIRAGVLPFHFCVKSFLTLVDLLSLFFIVLIAERQKLRVALVAAAFYLNPISILITAGHGAFDNLAILPVLAGLYFYLHQTPESRAGKFFLWLGSSAGLWIKHIIFFMPFVCVNACIKNPIKKVIALSFTLIGFFLLFMPYWSGAHEEIVHRLFFYTTAAPEYGMRWITHDWKDLAIPFAVSTCLFPLFISKKPIPNQCLLSMLFFIVFTPIVGAQYFILPLALGALCLSSGFVVYSVVGSLFILGSPINVHLEWLSWVRGNYLWLAAIYWFVLELRRRPADLLTSP